jgi:hypothetical protein
MAEEWIEPDAAPRDRGPRRGRRGPQGPRIPWRPPRAALRGVVIAAAILVGVIVFLTGRGGIVEIGDAQVAVKVNYLTGNRTLITQPGYQVFIPWFSEVFLLDKSPNEFIMEGNRDVEYNHVRELRVRANDGSTFWFEIVKIQYQLIPSMAPQVLDDSGFRDAFKRNWVRAAARSILRDEFGRFTAEEVADPTNYGVATIRATERLNEVLAPHGIEIIQILTPKPKFDPAYEEAIEERKVANQEVERLKIELEQLHQERLRLIAEVEREKATEYEQLLGDLEAARIQAERQQIEKEKSADAHRITERNRGIAEEKALVQQAIALETLARKEAEGLQARVRALEERGEILVRERLAALFATITFEVIPYRRDPSPIRIEHLGGAVPAAAEVEGGRSRP